jgi:hypothetical protein
MNLYHHYTYSQNKQIWRIIPGSPGKLVIEERDPDTREVFFSCIDLNSGNVLLDNLQFDEKFWVGVEDVYKDVIFFHKYQKPDLPGHADIIAYDINKKEELWRSEKYLFSLVYDNKLYCFRNFFEGKKYYQLDYLTGELLSELDDDFSQIGHLKSLRENEVYKGYQFPDVYNSSVKEIDSIIEGLKSEELISGKIDYFISGQLLLISYHTILDDGKLRNNFRALDINSKMVIFEETLNKEITNYIPDSFFLINNLVFLLKEKETLFVFLIND